MLYVKHVKPVLYAKLLCEAGAVWDWLQSPVPWLEYRLAVHYGTPGRPRVLYVNRETANGMWTQ